MYDSELRDHVDAVVPAGVTHIGFIAVDPKRRVLVLEPKGGPDPSITATIPKVRLNGERPADALDRCLRQWVGCEAESVYPMSVAWGTPHSVTFYFMGRVEAGNDSPSQTAWYALEEAERRIGRSRNTVSRRRDLALLAEVAATESLYPPRRVLLMVRELHRMGYERLRAPAFFYHLGSWRCPVYPVAAVLAEHGGLFSFDAVSSIRPCFEGELVLGQYSSASGQLAFGWDDVVFATPRELARRFLDRAPTLARLGLGRDPAYAEWFERMLEMTAPDDLIFSDAEYVPPARGLFTVERHEPWVPLPPPGEYRSGVSGGVI